MNDILFQVIYTFVKLKLKNKASIIFEPSNMRTKICNLSYAHISLEIDVPHTNNSLPHTLETSALYKEANVRRFGIYSILWNSFATSCVKNGSVTQLRFHGRRSYHFLC
jgi:hypothetical protein